MEEAKQYKKLKPEFKAKWLEALRSGKYAQTQQCLKDDSGFCCLGVAADIIDPSTWVMRPRDDFYSFVDPSGNKVSSWFNQYLYNVTGLDSDAESILMQMNDDNGSTFEQIADWIEENL
jgi:hypothetical protein